MKNKKILMSIAFILLVLLVGYNFIGKANINNISASELAEKLQKENGSNEVVFIDVREPSEYQSGHIEGMTNIPLSTLKTDYHQIPKDSEVVLICRSGNRSMQAAKLLNELGYENIVNVDGGVQGWQGELVK